MSTLNAQGYWQNAARTEGELKTYVENLRDVVAELLGGSARTELTIAAGAIVPPDGAGGGVHTIDTESDASSDTLTSVTLTNVPDGRMLLFFTENPARVVTITHGAGGSGQFLFRDGVDYTFPTPDAWVLVQRVGSDLIELARHSGTVVHPLSVGTLCPHEGLSVKYVSATTVDIDADRLELRSAAHVALTVDAVNLTVNLGTTGANGRDSSENSGNEKASDWYHLWVIAQPDGTAAAFATLDCWPGSGTAIHTRIPAGYTFAGYVGAARNDGSSNVVQFEQRNASVSWLSATKIIDASASATYATASTTSAAPDSARAIRGMVSCYHSSSPSDLYFGSDHISTTRLFSNLLGGMGVRNLDTGSDNWSPFSELLITRSDRAIVWGTDSAGTAATMFVSGWRY